MIRWLDCTLPPTYEAFRTRLHTLFPIIYDTKYLSSSGVIGDTLEYYSLEKCYDHYMKIGNSNSCNSPDNLR